MKQLFLAFLLLGAFIANAQDKINQLDDKGKAQVTRYHEKHSKGGVNKKDRVANLREQFLQKTKKK